MSHQVLAPPSEALLADGSKPGGWWHAEGDRLVCDLCPRFCSLKDGDRGFCFVRQNRGGQMVLTTYGRSTGFCIDPIEKKPLNHFYPGTSVLSFGTAGCNLGCKFCQNWSISKSREVERLSELAMPDVIAEAAASLGCRSVAFTYNDPVIWAEYAIDTARACRERGIKTVAVTAGYITPEARPEFYQGMDAANVDLKGFTEDFYRHLTLSHLGPVLDTLRWLKHESDVWLEITNLVIPEENDSPEELRRMCDWILENLGDEVPLHFTAFHPDFRLRHRPPTPPGTLVTAREIALSAGLKYVYTGNVNDLERQSTYCAGCGRRVIERNWYDLGAYHLDGNQCRFCGHRIPGHFDPKPGTWGNRRQPVDMLAFSRRRHEGPPLDSRPQSPAPSSEGPLKTIGSSDAPQANAKDDDGPGSFVALNAEQERLLLTAANELVEAAVTGRQPQLDDPDLGGLAGQPISGVFVSLKRAGQLRACCGAFGAAMPLGTALSSAAFRSATSDPRFRPIAAQEISDLDAEVWILQQPRRVDARGEDRLDAVEIGRHGLQISRGSARGLLLPSVPIEHGWDRRAFLEYVCRKAQLEPEAWKKDDAELFTFEGSPIRGRFVARRPAPLPLWGSTVYFDAGAAFLQGHPASVPRAPAAAGKPAPNGKTIRRPAVAGTFYPGKAAELDALVAGMLSPGVTREPWSALQVPHAGLIYSGALAARGFERVQVPEVVLVVGPKHTPYGAGWSVAPHDLWALPGHEIASDPEMARGLAGAITGLELDAAAHEREHSIEVELPFLAKLAPDSRVVGIVMGQATLDECKGFAQELADFLNRFADRVLLVISSDLNHFAPEPENRRRDQLALEAMQRMDADVLYHAIRDNQISMCGVLPAVVVLETLRLQGRLNRCEVVGYTNSAAATGDTRRVVGYSSVLFG